LKNKLALVVAVVLGLIAVFGIKQWMNTQTVNNAQKNRTTRVAAAGKRIVAGTHIDTSCMLKEESKDRNGVIRVLKGIEIPEAAVTAENISTDDEDKLFGLTINRTVERGEPLLVSYFRQPVEKLDAQLHLGERAITLRVDAITGVASNVAPGSHVDIIGTFPLAQQAGAAPVKAAGAAASRTLLLFQDVTIIAVDNRTRDEDYVASPAATRSRNYSSVTVAATPLEANVLVFAQQYGTLTLALRPPTDSLPPSAQIEINESNVIKSAEDAEKARQERLKNSSPITATPMP
jgi:pilus assembly protein CpaB